MIEQLLKDASEHPRIFIWRGPLDSRKIDTWSSPNRVEIPMGLRQLWTVTGGGDIFESETILSPLTKDPEFDIEAVNEFYWEQGVEKKLLIFHVGAWLSAVRNASPCYVSFNTENFATRAEFGDFDAWYVEGMREEYAQRYGLAVASNHRACDGPIHFAG